jgi:two-component system OmpR family sensor kinase
VSVLFTGLFCRLFGCSARATRVELPEATTSTEARVKSVRTQLVISLILGLGAMSLVATYGLFRSAQEEANELFDYELRSVALSLPPSVADAALATRPAKDFEGLLDDRVVIQIWADSGKDVFLSVPGAELPKQPEGFRSVEVGERHYRVFGLQQASRFVQLSQPTFVRDELALKLAWRTLWPLLAIVPLEIALVLLVTKRALRPVNRLSRNLAGRSIESLQSVGNDMDVPSEVRPLVDALNDLLKRLQSVLQSQRTFVADAAHELRTPLTALKLQIQCALRDGIDSSNPRFLRGLEDRVNRAIHLVQQLLTLAREDAEVDARLGPVDLLKLAARTVGDLSILAEAKEIDLGLVSGSNVESGSAVVVWGDENSLTTLVTNLIDNALRYTERGGRVDVHVVEAEWAVTLEVVDNGPGIPPDEVNRVLDRFYRAENTSGQGSGLGLAIAAKIAAKHRATLELRNRADGRGLVVSVAGLRSA